MSTSAGLSGRSRKLHLMHRISEPKMIGSAPGRLFLKPQHHSSAMACVRVRAALFLADM
jgi:hypothetical protein